MGINPSVTYTGQEVAIVAGLIACSLPALDEDEFEVADLLLDRALASLPQPLAPDLAARISGLRVSPAERFWAKLAECIPPGQDFGLLNAALAVNVPASRAFVFLEQLCGRKPLRRVDLDHWVIES